MKIRTIICFIFSILGLLALVAYFFPEDGIAVGSVRMKFPSLTEVLQTEEEKETLPTDTVSTDTLSTEELLQMRMDALKAEKESEFMTYCETNAARIYMPGDNIDYLDPFFDALEAARERPVRIMHYGDSQLEGDRISSVLREAFQERFGGSGVGLAPAVQTVPTYTLSQSVSPEGPVFHARPPAFSARFPLRSNHAPDQRPGKSGSGGRNRHPHPERNATQRPVLLLFP